MLPSQFSVKEAIPKQPPLKSYQLQDMLGKWGLSTFVGTCVVVKEIENMVCRWQHIGLWAGKLYTH